MSWVSIALFVLQLLLRRFGVMRAQGATAEPYAGPDVDRLAGMISAAEPRLSLDCVKRVLPGLLKDLGEYLDATAGDLLGDPGRLFDIAVAHVTALVKCQFAASGRVMTRADSDLRDKIIKCGLSAAVSWFQTRDVAAAVSQFFSCILGGSGGGGGGGGEAKPVLNQVQRCPG